MRTLSITTIATLIGVGLLLGGGGLAAYLTFIGVLDLAGLISNLYGLGTALLGLVITWVVSITSNGGDAAGTMGPVFNASDNAFLGATVLLNGNQFFGHNPSDDGPCPTCGHQAPEPGTSDGGGETD